VIPGAEVALVDADVAKGVPASREGAHPETGDDGEGRGHGNEDADDAIGA